MQPSLFLYCTACAALRFFFLQPRPTTSRPCLGCQHLGLEPQRGLLRSWQSLADQNKVPVGHALGVEIKIRSGCLSMTHLGGGWCHVVTVPLPDVPLIGYHQVWVCGKALGWINRDKTRTKPAPTPRLPVGTGEPIFYVFRQRLK